MIILASGSPRRRELMKQITNDYIVITSDIDEEKSYVLPPLEAVLDVAKRKGEKVFLEYPDDIVISADTIVVLNNQIIHKPINAEDAKRILGSLSNKTHQVITAYCIFSKGEFIENHVVSEVTFNQLNNVLIDDYVATGSPLDKAGAYGVQDNKQFPIIKNVIGSVDNVIGFPIKEIKRDLEKVMKKLD